MEGGGEAEKETEGCFLLTFQQRQVQNSKRGGIKSTRENSNQAAFCYFLWAAGRLCQLILRAFQTAKLQEEIMTAKVKRRTEDSC